MRKFLSGIVTSLILLTVVFSVMPTAFATLSSTNNKNVYNGDGSRTTWAYTFPIILTSDINIYTISSTGTVTPITSNYSINTSTSMVTYPVSGSPLASDGSEIVLYRQEPLTQTSSLKNQYRLPLDVIELALDKQMMVSQQLQEQISRSILSPINTTSASGTGLSFPPASGGQVIGWTADATALTNYNIQGLSPTATPTFAGITLSSNALTIGNLGGILKASGGVVGTATADSDYSTPTGTETFTNKTFDTSGTGNVFKIGGTTFSGGLVGSGSSIVLANSVSGNSGKVAQSSGSLVAGNCAKWDSSGNLIDNGSTCSGGSGMVYPASSGFAVSNASSWLTSISTSGGIADSNINWQSIKSIGTSNVNWTSVNGLGTISGGINWTGIQGIVKSQNVNWNDINGFSKLNSGGVNWANINANGPINGGGINWTNFPASGIAKFNGSSALAAATSGTDYAPATSGNSILYGNNLGGFSNATIGSGILFSGGNLSSGFVPINIQVFTATGTWTKPAGISNVYVKLWGGGAGANNDATGGGAGEYTEAPCAVTGNVTVTIGAGGAGDNPGGTTSFSGSVTLSAAGGTQGVSGGTGGTGGTHTNGFSFPGDNGTSSTTLVSYPGVRASQYGAGSLKSAGATTGTSGLVIIYY